MVSKAQLKPFQLQKVGELSAQIAEFALKPGRGAILYEAPTGSGKTVTLAWTIADTVDQLQREADKSGLATPNVLFLWLSLGKGDLEQQSLAVLKSVMPARTLWIDDLKQTSQVVEGGVVVANWEKLKAKRKGSAFASYEEDLPGKTSLKTVIRQLKSDGDWKVVAIIDESHEAAGSVQSQNIIDAFQVDVVVEATATPLATRIAAPRSTHFSVDKATARAQGLIKAGTITNSGLAQYQEESPDEGLVASLVGCALRKRDALEEALSREVPPSAAVPLLLIQLESGWDSKERQEEVEALLEDHGISRDRKNLAVWLSEEHINRDFLKQLDSPVKCLIFKVAIATGWDCPRSHVLLQLRDTVSTTLEEQVLGRICRTAEPHRADPDTGDCYVNDELNYAYVYSQYKPEKVIRFDGTEDNGALYADSYRASAYSALMLHSRFVKHSRRQGLGTSTAELTVNLVKAWAAVTDGLPVLNIVTRELADGLRFALDNQVDAEGQKVLVPLSADEVSRLFDREFHQALPGSVRKFARAVFKPALEDALISLVPEIDSIQAAQAYYVNYREVLNPALVLVAKAAKEVTREGGAAPEVSENLAWEVPEYLAVPEKGARYSGPLTALHQLYPASLSGPEQRFIAHLESITGGPYGIEVAWMVKNGKDSEKAFGVPYADAEGELHNAFPDFLVMFNVADTNVLAACEIKDDEDRDAETVLKATAIQAWLARKPTRQPSLQVVGDVFKMTGETPVGLSTGEGLVALVRSKVAR